jgi:methylmalonyl-CoA epimerase
MSGINRTMEGPTKIAHIGIAVESIDTALAFYRDGLGLEVSEVLELPERGLRIAMLPCGESMLELMEPLGPDSQISRFLEKRGPGIHHLCLGVPDIQARLDALDERGVRLVNRKPEIGAEGLPVAFIHPKASEGVLLELLEEG